MLRHRVPAVLALVVALALGLAPWRICAHADGEHGRVWMQGVSHGHAHDHGHGHPHGHTHGHAPHHHGHDHDDHEHEAPGGPALEDADACSPEAGCPEAGCPEAGCTRAGHGHEGAWTSHDGEGAPDHCHCGDQPLTPGLAVVLVALDAPDVCRGWADPVALALLDEVPEVASAARPRAARVAAEEEPVVLLR